MNLNIKGDSAWHSVIIELYASIQTFAIQKYKQKNAK